LCKDGEAVLTPSDAIRRSAINEAVKAMRSPPETDGEAFIEKLGVADRVRRHGPQILDRGLSFN